MPSRWKTRPWSLPSRSGTRKSALARPNKKIGPGTARLHQRALEGVLMSVRQNVPVQGARKNEFRQLRLEGVSRQFVGANALDKLSLTIERGEFIGRLGPSLRGKATAVNST